MQFGGGGPCGQHGPWVWGARICRRRSSTWATSLLLSLSAIACGGAGGATARGDGGNISTTSGDGPPGANDAGIDGSTCTLPPTDARTPAPMPDNVTFLANVTVSTLAGGATSGTTNGPSGVGLLDNPVSVAIEASGAIAVSDFDNDRLRRMVAADGTLSTLTNQSNFTRPFGLAVVGGVLYAQTDTNPVGQKDASSGTIWRIDATTGAATVIGANVGRPRSFAALSDGKLALADYENQRVRIFDPTSGAVSDLAGLQGCLGSANGTAGKARFTEPRGLVVVAGDRIIVADRTAHILREVSRAGVVTTFAGDGVAGTIDGPRAGGVRFDQPAALAADAAGDVFVSDFGAHRIRRIAADGTVTTVAGTGTGGFMDGPGNSAEFYGQEGIAVSPDGATIYIADGTLGDEPPGPYHRIRKITIGP